MFYFFRTEATGRYIIEEVEITMSGGFKTRGCLGYIGDYTTQFEV